MSKNVVGVNILICVLFLFVSGCTRSLPLSYNKGLDGVQVSVATNKKIGITKFKDARSNVVAGEEKSDSIIANQGPYRFGFTYSGREFFPVNSFVQDTFVEEFKTTGMNAKKIDIIPANQSIELLKNISMNESVDYVLAGEIINFEFVNEVGVWTVTSAQKVTLSLNLVSSDGKVIFSDSTFSDVNRENEGMAVLHTTNLEKLVNKVFKNVLVKVLDKMSNKMAIEMSNIRVKIAVNGSGAIYFKYINGEFVVS